MAHIQTQGTRSDLLLCLNGLDFVALLIDVADKLLEPGAVESFRCFDQVACLGIGVQKDILEPGVDLVSELGVVGIGLVLLVWLLYLYGILSLRTTTGHLKGMERDIWVKFITYKQRCPPYGPIMTERESIV
jgi:hypothetical protein